MSRIDPEHNQIRGTLRILGPGVVALGVIFSVIGIGNFFYCFGSGVLPRYFWCAFVGFPLLAVGATVCRYAFLGTVARYVADEVSPVGKDVVNYMADETKDAVRTMTAAVGEGLRDGASSKSRCRNCNAENDADAKFCKHCGEKIAE